MIELYEDSLLRRRPSVYLYHLTYLARLRARRGRSSHPIRHPRQKNKENVSTLLVLIIEFVLLLQVLLHDIIPGT